TPVWSSDGKTILFSREDSTGASLMKFDISCASNAQPGACEAFVQPITSQHYDLDPAWSPDGTQIVYAASEVPGQPQKIVLTDPAGKTFTALPGTITSDFAPMFSPDGKKIIFVSYAEGNDDLWMM